LPHKDAVNTTEARGAAKSEGELAQSQPEAAALVGSALRPFPAAVGCMSWCQAGEVSGASNLQVSKIK
jgi:hypothetical protein